MDSETLTATEAYAASNASAPRVTLQGIRDQIVAEHYVNAFDAIAAAGQTTVLVDRFDTPLKLMTLCFLVMSNGYTVVGKSACVSPENYDAKKGRRFAYEDAIEQLWPLCGFALRDQLHKQASQV